MQLSMLAVLAVLAAPAGASSFPWLTGNYSVLIGPNPLAADDTVTATTLGDKNFSGINFTNDGGLIWQTTDRMGFLSSTFINNGLVDMQADANLQYAGGSASAFTNNNVFRKSGAAGVTEIKSNIVFSNFGTVDAQSGMIDFSGGATTFHGGTVFTGAGVNRVSSNANFNDAVSSSNLLLSAGGFTGAGAAGAIINGVVQWNGGSFIGNWHLPTNQTLNVGAGIDKNFSSVNFTNDATINWQSDERIGFLSTTFANNGVFDVQTDADFTFVGASASTFTNSPLATLRKSGGAGVTEVKTNVVFSNFGIIDAQTGTIDFTGGLATFHGGTQFVGAGTKRISSNATFNDAFTSTNLQLTSGNYTGGGIAGAVINGAVQWNGGNFIGNWHLPTGQTLNVGAGIDKNFSGVNFTNDATINWQSDERIGFLSTTFANNGVFDVQTDADFTFVGASASTFTNSPLATLRKSGGAGVTEVRTNFVFSNFGIIDAQTGTIDFSGGLATFHGGTQFVGPGTKRISSNATFNDAFTSTNLQLTSGNYTGGGIAGAVINGAVQWNGGNFIGNWHLPTGQTLNVGAGVDKNFSGVNFTNDATINWQTDERVGFLSTTFTNNGLFDIEGDANLTYIGASASTFTNSASAVFRKSAGPGTTVVGANVLLANSGTIDAQSGTIEFAGSGAVFNGGTLFTGAGVNRVVGSATFNGSFDSHNLLLNGGAYSGNAAILNGNVAWHSGQMNGTWTVAAGQTLVAEGAADKNFSGAAFVNNGTLVWNTSDRIGFLSTTLTNNGLVDIQQDANLTFVGASASSLVNAGILRKSGGTGTTTIGSNIILTNPGTIEALSGTIKLPNNFTNTGTIKGTASIQTNALTNVGTIAPGTSPGLLTLDGDLIMGATGILDIELGGLADFDSLAVTGTVLLDGILTVRHFGAYAPQVGDSFEILTYASRVGTSEFDSVNPVGWGSGVAFAVAYNIDNTRLTVTAVPEPGTYAMMLAGLGLLGGIAWRRRTS